MSAIAKATNGELATVREIDTQLLRETVCKGSTEQEFSLFVAQCRRTGLDPFSRQIHAVKRWDAKLGREVMSIQTGIDGYRLIADRTGLYAGSDEAVFDREDGVHPNKATVTVWKLVGGQRVPFSRSARWTEFVQTKKDGTPNQFWQRMPYHMLAKVAESLALRAAFPQELSGIYTDDEMPDIEQAQAAPAPAAKTAPAKPSPFDLARKAIQEATTLDALATVWVKLSPDLQASLAPLKEQRKRELGKPSTPPADDRGDAYEDDGDPALDGTLPGMAPAAMPPH